MAFFFSITFLFFFVCSLCFPFFLRFWFTFVGVLVERKRKTQSFFFFFNIPSSPWLTHLQRYRNSRTSVAMWQYTQRFLFSLVLSFFFFSSPFFFVCCFFSRCNCWNWQYSIWLIGHVFLLFFFCSLLRVTNKHWCT